ncbi:Beta-hexosaminidase [Candidatus Ornithobacterium hominis]|uniref:glycoside hydrolase family 20 protein n=1 Tax=Candidatus Ornithobacterium hominis TaxID=2497989 RepID=UPI000E5AC0D3|nr:family 20 glycosylhydrolase [Candidatus Ornithobacterium hominis]SZD72828.1 Beta-hexosaminidase [Candidatus Ornithobacterium hominis]
MKINFLILFSFFLSLTIFAQKKSVGIIPEPKEIKLLNGEFEFTPQTIIYFTDDNQRGAVEQLQYLFSKSGEFVLKATKMKPSKNFISLEKNQNLEKEAYRLSVKPNQIAIEASTVIGFSHAIASLRQLLPVQVESKTSQKMKWKIPAMEIKDEPRFAWRGLMLDVSRHFFPKEYILKTLDRMALLKLNTFHWHLVDDQGWRIEIKKYPKLTEIGAWRVDHENLHWNNRPDQKPGEKATYGGFYTQEEIKEVVAYAEKLGITVVPEIEMPAHVSSAIAAYPWLSCTEEKITVPPGGVWPIVHIYDPGKESTFEFLENVLAEVMQLFPSEYIHIGGDEATKTKWETCKTTQDRMKQLGIEDVDELQSYMIKRIEEYLNKHGRKIIGWDEILEGGLAPRAAVMSWRGMKGGIEAAQSGHDVVMTPGVLYFDGPQGMPDVEPQAFGSMKTLGKVYDFEPIPAELNQEEGKHILGPQANLWAEYIHTTEHSEYMLYPRLFALSEIAWSPVSTRNKKEFYQKTLSMMKRWDLLGINYAKSIFDVTGSVRFNQEKEKKQVILDLNNEFPGEKEIRYTIDDADLSEKSPKFFKPLEINKTSTIRAGLFIDGKLAGKVYKKNIEIHKAINAKVSYEPYAHKSYTGQGEKTMANITRGSLDFHDGQWQAWLNDDVTLTLDLGQEKEINQVKIGAMENQGSGIYYPIGAQVWVSEDGVDYISVGKFTRPYADNGYAEITDFAFDFELTKARYIKVFVDNLGKAPYGGDAWMFVDEILVN